MVSDKLKNKVINLINETSKSMDIKIKTTAKIKDFRVLKINIQSCSIDLKQNQIETIKNLLENGCLLGTDREYLTRTLANIEDTKDMPTYVQCSEHSLKKLFSGKALDLIEKIYSNIRCDYYENSDVSRDYFDVAYYYDLSIGNNKVGFQVIG